MVRYQFARGVGIVAAAAGPIGAIRWLPTTLRD
jgi:hypothetical protein